MADLFDAAQNAAILARIDSISPDSRPVWGKMDVAQMLAHCQVALEVALGQRTLKRGLIGFLFGGLARRQLLAPKPFGKNLPTAPEFRVADRRDFATEKSKLLALIRRFAAVGPDGLTKAPHPFFGALTPEEWSTLQWKHLDHHLRQFAT